MNDQLPLQGSDCGVYWPARFSGFECGPFIPVVLDIYDGVGFPRPRDQPLDRRQELVPAVGVDVAILVARA